VPRALRDAGVFDRDECLIVRDSDAHSAAKTVDIQLSDDQTAGDDWFSRVVGVDHVDTTHRWAASAIIRDPNDLDAFAAIYFQNRIVGWSVVNSHERQGILWHRIRSGCSICELLTWPNVVSRPR
jgi:hypothetical protein